MNEKEIWAPIKDYEGLYEVSSFGRVRSLKRKAPYILKPCNNGYGYLTVSLIKDGKQKTVKIHRLVGETFIPNPDNLPTLDHIDKNKKNNYSYNLRWVSYQEQNNNRNNRNPDVKNKVRCVETGQIFINSLKAAEWVVNQGLSISIANEVAKRIRYLCRGEGYKTAYGYHWEFYYEEATINDQRVFN